ncbi:Uncharacterised protein [Acinetobacter pittii]|uniref:hypothetical protein n=1 Tax=Acinetobacter pittii TaxID=48296 RepID=UPI00030FA399|nr:hypothetical protein [Acinetobacter pittii]MDP7813826.1 hypothetical protein [Acinetobacter pittii]SSP31605.1 Uncharacterised protein [Acinetobacter pittii]
MNKINLISKLYDEFKNSEDFEKLDELENDRKIEIFLSEKIHSNVLPFRFSQSNTRYRVDDYFLIIDPKIAPPFEEKQNFIDWLYSSITEKHLLTVQD